MSLEELISNLDLTELRLDYKTLNKCPDLSRHTKLIKLCIAHNEITELENLPPNLKFLRCEYN
jgi:hypothetical protein